MDTTRPKIQKTQITQNIDNRTEDSQQQSTHSGVLIGSNDDLLTQILLRVPAISILRFKSVSKHWQRLLSNRHFTLRYDKLLKSPALIARRIYVPFDFENLSTAPSSKLDFYPDPYGIKIVQSCNGLLLCCSNRGEERDRKYYVFNPTTKQFAIIPPLPGGRDVLETIRFMGLAFHPTDFVRYKVVCIHTKRLGGEFFQIQVCSSDTRKWKIYGEFFADMPVFVTGVYWNGAMHWAPAYDNHFYFQIEDEQLGSLPLPVEMTSFETWTKYFGESRGHLHLVVGNDVTTDLLVNVYEMLSDYSGWVVKYQVELHGLPGAIPEINYSSSYYYEVIDVVRGDKEEDTFVVLLILGKLITYNVHDKSFKQISDLANYPCDEFLNCHRYIESLSSF